MTVSSDELAKGVASFTSISFPQPFRRCQLLALDAFEAARSAGRIAHHFVLPPGAGKTILGLEIARRSGRPTLVLCPNTAIQSQWASQWASFQPACFPCSTDAGDLAAITALTYQSICALEDDDETTDLAISLWKSALRNGDGLSQEEAEEAISQLRDSGSPHYENDLGRFRRRARLAMAKNEPSAELLALLHPNGRDLLERMKEVGPWTLVLDECHHLLEMWGYLVRGVIGYLGDDTSVVGLTATPPRDLDVEQRRLYQELFQQPDMELPTPAAVKDGSLAPYQDLVYLTTPMLHELDYIDEQHSRFLRLISRLLDQDFGSVPFVEWMQRQAAGDRQTKQRGPSWGTFERERPTFAVALLRFLNQYRLELPEDTQLQERHRQPLTADDWVVLLQEYCMKQLKPSADERDSAAWEEVRVALPGVGYVLTTSGVRSYVASVDRVLSLSASKAAAALAILAAEERGLGKELRALILCDYERAGSDLLAKLRGVLDPQAGSAALILRILLSDSQSASLDPVLMTGRTVACSRATAVNLIGWLQDKQPNLRDTLDLGQIVSGRGAAADWDEIVTIAASTSWWRPRNYVPLVTEYFETGGSRCLVGTRGLLGEGWDAKRVNVMIDLTAATTSTAVHQSRGRSLRLDPALPEKVADNWDVVCVSPRHPRGFSDYARFVRKHRNYYGLTPDGEIECGVSHVHAGLSPYGAPSDHQFGAINRRQLERPVERSLAVRQWGVGKPYENRETQTLRVMIGRPENAPKVTPVRSAKKSKQSIDDLGADWGTVLGLSVATVGPFLGPAILSGLLSSPFDFLLRIGLFAGGVVALAVRAARSPLLRCDDTNGVRQVAEAVVEALCEIEDIGVGVGRLQVVRQADGYYRCFLESTLEDSTLFSDTLDSILSPLGNPRCIVPRYVLSESGALSRLRQASSVRRKPSTSGAQVVWHAVPPILSSSKARIDAFEKAWNHRVGPGRVLYSHGYLAREIIRAQHGENPLGVDTQERALWR